MPSLQTKGNLEKAIGDGKSLVKLKLVHVEAIVLIINEDLAAHSLAD